jgi:predicted DCC family thiol-disulfide oxidoreductase YuxK
LIYDADCGFCTSSATWLARHGSATLQPWQGADLAALGLTEQQVTEAAYWLDGEGRVAARGARAIAQALRTCRGALPLAGRAIDLPPVRPLAAGAYRWVAEHRHLLPGGTPACRVTP